ncbi:MAG: ankyrin repeat domain-containing protein [Alphaproteobacteria bacterium]
MFKSKMTYQDPVDTLRLPQTPLSPYLQNGNIEDLKKSLEKVLSDENPAEIRRIIGGTFSSAVIQKKIEILKTLLDADKGKYITNSILEDAISNSEEEIKQVLIEYEWNYYNLYDNGRVKINTLETSKTLKGYLEKELSTEFSEKIDIINVGDIVVTDADLEYIAINFPNIEYLIFQNARNITDKGRSVLTLLESFKGMIFIDLFLNISSEIKPYLISMLPCLKENKKVFEQALTKIPEDKHSEFVFELLSGSVRNQLQENVTFLLKRKEIERINNEQLGKVLYYAVQNNYNLIVDAIIASKHGENIELSYINLALELAIKNNNENIVKNILNYTKVKIDSNLILNIFEWAVHKGSKDTVEFLISSKMIEEIRNESLIFNLGIAETLNHKNNIVELIASVIQTRNRANENFIVEQPNPGPVSAPAIVPPAQEPVNNNPPAQPPAPGIPPVPPTNRSIFTMLINVISKVVNWENLVIGGILSASSVQNLLKSNNAWKGFSKLIAPATNLFESAVENAVSSLALKAGTQNLAKSFVRSSAPIVLTIAAVRSITVFRNTNQTNGVIKSLFSATAAFAETALEGGVSNIAAAATTTIATAAVATLEAGMLASAAPVVATVAGAAMGAYAASYTVQATKATVSWAGNKAKSFAGRICNITEEKAFNISF